MKIKLKITKMEIFRVCAIIIAMIGVLSTNIYLNTNISAIQNAIIQDQLVDIKFGGDFDYFNIYSEKAYKTGLYDVTGIEFNIFRSAKMNSMQTIISSNITDALKESNQIPIDDIYIIAIDYDILNSSTYSPLISQSMRTLNKKSIYLNQFCLDSFNLVINSQVDIVPIDYNIYTDEPVINDTGYYQPIEFFTSFTIEDELEVNSWEKFLQLFSIYPLWPYAEQSNLILMDDDIFYNEIYSLANSIYELNFELDINVKIPTSQLLNLKYNEIKEKFNHISQIFYNNHEYYLRNGQSLLINKIDTYRQEIQIFRFLLLIFSIPAFIIGMWFLITIQKSIIQRDSDSILIKRINGRSRKSIHSVYLINSIFVGLIGGAFSYILSYLVSITFKNRFLEFNFYNLDKSIDLSNVKFDILLFTISIFSGIILSSLSTQIILKKITKNSKFLTKVNFESDFFLLKTKKSRFLKIFVIMIILLIYSLFEVKFFNETDNVFLESLSFYLYPILSFSSIFIPYFIISAASLLILLYSEKIFQFFKFSVPKLKKKHFERDYLYSKFQRNIKDKYKIIFLISLSLGFVFQVLIISNSITNREYEKNLVLNGNSDIAFNIEDLDFSNNNDFLKITRDLDNHLNPNIYKKYIYIPELNSQFYKTSSYECTIRGMELDDWKEYFNDMPKSWFSLDFDTILEQLEKNNTLIASKGYLEEQGLMIGDNITINYQLNDTCRFERIFTIIGFYTRLPFYGYLSYDIPITSIFYSNIKNFPNFSYENIKYGFKLLENSNLNLEQEYLSLINHIGSLNVSGKPIIDDTFSSQLRFNTVEVLYFDFLEILSTQFFIIIGGGIIWVMQLQIINEKANWAKIKRYGGNSNFLFRITAKEYMSYFGIGFILAILSLFGNVGIIGFLNDTNIDYPYSFDIPYGKLLFNIGVLSILFLTSLYVISTNQIKSLKSNK